MPSSPCSARRRRRHAAEWSNNSVRFWYGTAFAEPGINENVEKSVFAFTHASGYKLGSNFLNINLLYSNNVDRVNNTPSAGAAEVYATYRHTLSLSKVTKRSFAFGPVRDVGIDLGFDVNTKNTTFAGRKIMPAAGASVGFKVPGFLNLGVLVNKEWNTNGVVIPNVKPRGLLVEFDPTLMLTAAWNIKVYGPVTFEGFGSVNLPKGEDGFGRDTVTEVLFHPKAMVDVGTLWGSKGWQLGVGWQYWLNKFGNDHDIVVGSKESAAFFEVAVTL